LERAGLRVRAQIADEYNFIYRTSHLSVLIQANPFRATLDKLLCLAQINALSFVAKVASARLLQYLLATL